MILINFRWASSASISSGRWADTLFNFSTTQIMRHSMSSFWASRYSPARLNISNLLPEGFGWNQGGDFSTSAVRSNPGLCIRRIQGFAQVAQVNIGDAPIQVIIQLTSVIQPTDISVIALRTSFSLSARKNR